MLPSDEDRLLPARPLRVSRAFHRELLISGAGLLSIGGGFLALSFGLFGWRAFLMPFVVVAAAGTSFVAWVVWQRLALVHACARRSDEIWLRVVGPEGDQVQLEGEGEIAPECWGAGIQRDGVLWMLALRAPGRSPHPRVFERWMGPMFRWQLLPVESDGSPFLLDADQRRRLRERLTRA